MMEEKLEQRLVALLKTKGKTLGTAESCTGGWIAKRITDVPGASQVFRGGVVAYTNEVKRQLLGVPAALLETKGAVSPETARAMAAGARAALGCDMAVSVTGLAGPEGDEFGHPGGTVFLAAESGKELRCVQLPFAGTDRDTVRRAAAELALELALALLEDG